MTDQRSSSETLLDYRKTTAAASVRFTFRMTVRDTLLALSEKGISLEEGRSLLASALDDAFADAKEERRV